MSQNFLPVEDQLAILKRGIVELHVEAQLREKLEESRKTGRPLRIKLGADPSAPDLHLGHTVVLQKLRQFQELGHQVIFLIGDFTARIGDPTGKSETRKPLSEEDVRVNSETYTEQVFKILDREKTEIAFNSTWMGAMSATDLIKLAAQHTVARMLERDDFKKRYTEGRSISVHEFLYPLVQAYDSVALHADVEIGGTDQLFNLLVGRQIQKEYGQAAQCVLTVPLLEGLDGHMEDGVLVGAKMSKSLDNFIGISEAPSEIFGKLMSISDELMWRYYELLSNSNVEQIAQLKAGHPMDAKKGLASELTARYHGANAAKEAFQRWQAQFSRREVPEDMPEMTLQSEAGELWIGALLKDAFLAPSTSEAIRLVKGGGVKIDGEAVTDKDLKLAIGEYIFKVGKRRWAKITVV
ncbi:MAG: tyrosine--tRNA ligase [Deltaproteobacteria bacterium CG2_30_63_29]|nr:MAG: tyrosine--tRNA ligase [Deltaproteobacteria bacterium CG2_30_63_29]PJB36138.1 MAG: tyrosine--tRNA ligase [Deltaproteobacteria bacterium CG_4_9_14_3_um_filter_63_12]